MRGAAVVLIAVFLAQYAYVNAQIPTPCANRESLRARKCCPTPDPAKFSNAGPCGSNLNPPRGSCQQIKIPAGHDVNAGGSDVRINWPLRYFNHACVCTDTYGGFDCGECSFAYKDGMTNDGLTLPCSQQTTRERKSLSVLDEEGWNNYRLALNKAKYTRSRYVIFTKPYVGTFFRNDIDTLLNSKKSITHYDLFIWMHHFVAKDNNKGTCMSLFRVIIIISNFSIIFS